jgi:rhamnulose-1-phosphate aldolase
MTHSLDTLFCELGAAGRRMVELHAAEGSAGNLSIFARDLEPPASMPERDVIDLPVAAPALAGGWLLVTGSARRLRDIERTPEETLCLFHVLPGGEQARRFAADGLRPTSEFNTHLAVHTDQVARHGWTTHAVAHAQPLRLTYLSHIARYADQATFNRSLLRWQPETILEFPEGIGTLPFETPGSAEQMRVTAEAMQIYRAVVWQRHGIVTRALTIAKAADLVEYAEAAAQYEYLNVVAGEPSQGLSDAEIRRIAAQYGVDQQIF